MKYKAVGLFALGTLFGLEGIKLLSSKDEVLPEDKARYVEQAKARGASRDHGG